jgi:hypothetical protein
VIYPKLRLRPPTFPLDVNKILYLLCLFAFSVLVTSLTYAQSSGQTFRTDNDNGLLTVSAEKADLKSLLTQFAEKTGVNVHFPKGLAKQITINLSGVSLRMALRRILKGEDYSLIYSASGKSRAGTILEVYVLPKSSTSKPSRRYNRPKVREKQVRASTARWEKRLETLKARMATVNENSTPGRAIRNQIRSTERTL